MYDIFITFLYLFVPGLVLLFSSLVKLPINYVLANVMTKMGVLFFMHIAFALATIIRSFLFIKISKKNR